MTIHRRIAIVVLLVLFAAPLVEAEPFVDERYHLSMQSPTGWSPMSVELLSQTNAQINHVTGRGFIAGYMLNDADTLVFPYMLVQFKPFSALPEEYRPKAKLDERGQLNIVYGLVGSFHEKGPLPEQIDTPQFADQFGSKFAVLTRLDAEYGRFDFAGKIPHEEGETPIEYHTHGLIGKDGIAIATVFTIEGYTGLADVIHRDMRTLGFDEGYTMAALPDEAPEPEPADTTNPSPGADTSDSKTEPEATEPQPAEVPAKNAVAAEADPPPVEPEPEVSPTGHADSAALIVILSLLGVVLFVSAFLAWFFAHKKAQAQREKRRARLERRHAAQASTQVQSKPRPASPIMGQARGSNDRRRHERTR